MRQARAVYTALVGGYEDRVEQPMARSSSIPFICFTDEPTLTSQTWEVVLVEPAFTSDHVRSARALKIVGHPRLDEFDQTLWIDNRVVLRDRPEAVLDAWLADVDLALPLHSYRDDLLDEFRAVVDIGYDEPARVYEQLWHYSRTMPHVLEQRPLWTAVIARRACDPVGATMRRWYEHVLRYSRRDQLSVLAALAQVPVSVGTHAIDNHASQWHQWLHPDAVGRRSSANDEAWRDAVAPPVAHVRRLEGQLAAVAAERDALARQQERMQPTIDELTAHVRALELTLAAQSDEASASRAMLDEVLGSTSWRVTAPLRSAVEARRLRNRRPEHSA